MKLAHCVRAVFPQHGYGGLERAGTDLTRHLLKRGVDVTLFTRALPKGCPFAVTSGTPGRLTVRSARYGRLPLRPNGIPARLTNYRAFVDEIGEQVEGMSRAGLVDGIYAQGLCAWSVRAAAGWGVPVVANPQGMEDFKVADPMKRLAYTPFRAWVRAGCRAADRVIATDYATRDEVPALLGVDPAKVVVIPNGVNIDDLLSSASDASRQRLAARWPVLANEHVTKGICVGRLEANKGFKYLLEALSLLPQDARWAWFVVGDGSLRDELEGHAGALGLSERVMFTGALTESDLHSLYSMCTIFAHPTLYEGSSLVTLEAMAHSLPVVASAVGGIPDKVQVGRTGFLAPPRDARALSESIRFLSERPEVARNMGEAGSALAAERFSWDMIAEATENLFRALIDEKAACAGRKVSHAPC